MSVALQVPLRADDGIEATQLFCHRRSVDHMNEQELGKLGGHTAVYTARDSFEYYHDASPAERERLHHCELVKDQSQVAERVCLKVGGRVITRLGCLL